MCHEIAKFYLEIISLFYVQSSQSHADESSEGIPSDAEWTPPNSFTFRREGARMVKERQPRRLIEFSEPESADDDSKDNVHTFFLFVSKKIIIFVFAEDLIF